jgi:hypothetical protein
MPTSDQEIYLRIFLRNKETEALRYLLWVKLRGEDFFWGSPRPAPDQPSIRLEPGDWTDVSVADDFADLPMASFKTSFHSSGVTHVTTTGSGAQELRDTYVGPISDLQEPTLFAALITAVPAAREDYVRSLTRGGARALVLDVPESQWTVRWYLDFSITPEGTFESWPSALLRGGGQLPVSAFQSLSEELDLLIVVRAAPIGDELNEWQPDKDLLV